MFENEKRKENGDVFPWRTKAQLVDCVSEDLSLFCGHHLIKSFCKIPFFLQAFIPKLLCSVLKIPEGLLCISCLGRYHRSPFSLCNGGLGVSHTHTRFHCVTDRQHPYPSIPQLIPF